MIVAQIPPFQSCSCTTLGVRARGSRCLHLRLLALFSPLFRSPTRIGQPALTPPRKNGLTRAEEIRVPSSTPRSYHTGLLWKVVKGRCTCQFQGVPSTPSAGYLLELYSAQPGQLCCYRCTSYLQEDDAGLLQSQAQGTVPESEADQVA